MAIPTVSRLTPASTPAPSSPADSSEILASSSSDDSMRANSGTPPEIRDANPSLANIVDQLSRQVSGLQDQLVTQQRQFSLQLAEQQAAQQRLAEQYAELKSELNAVSKRAADRERWIVRQLNSARADFEREIADIRQSLPRRRVNSADPEPKRQEFYGKLSNGSERFDAMKSRAAALRAQV